MQEDQKKPQSHDCEDENVSIEIKKDNDNLKVDIDAGDDVDIDIEKNGDNLEIKIITDDEIIDIEIHAKERRPVPCGKRYRIKVDRDYYIVNEECMLGKDILLLAGKQPNEYQLRQKLNSGSVITIGNDQKVCFTDPGIEKFKTLPLDQTEGEQLINGKVPRRDFTLLEEDADFLNSLQLPWEAIVYEGCPWVLVHGYPVPKGYNVSEAIMAIRMSPGYPTAQLDMLYFYPQIARADGQGINNLSLISLDGKQYQQWSRHRTALNAWRADIDNLSTHVPLADAWFIQEFKKRPYHAISA